MRNAIIGHSGYVGSYLKTKVTNCDYYNSQNIDSIRDKNYDVVYFAALPETKWLVNKEPKNDLQNVIKLQNILMTCHIGKFILISTIDVYDKKNLKQNEDDVFFTKEPYGANRRIMEEWVCNNFLDHHIIRLPALFGIGLKKNALFDLLNNNSFCKINPLDTYQWYYLDDLYDDINKCIKEKIPIINLFSEPIMMRDILLDLFVDVDFPPNDVIITYDFLTKYGKRSDYAYTKDYIISKMRDFILLWKQLEKNKDKFVISNLCWKDDVMAMNILSRYGISNLELAITKNMKWSDDLNKIKKLFKDFNIYSLQSLFYNVKHNIFENNAEFKEHFKLVINIAKELKAKKLVFGSPLNKFKPDGLNIDAANEIFINTFKELAEFLTEDMMICIEHNAIDYNCNYLKTIDEVIYILNKINEKNIKLNLDTGNAIMMSDAYCFDDIKDYVGHIQISAPFLKDIFDVKFDFKKFNDKISLEACNLEDFEKNLIHFIMQ